MAAASRNLPGPLGQAEAAFRDCAARLPPVSGELLAQRAGHFAAGIRLSLDEPAAMRRLHEMTGGLRRAASLSTLLPRILDGALSLMGADFGTLQLLDPVTGSLRLVTQSGFTFAFLDHFTMVEDGYSACGRVAREGAQVVITDVEADQGFAPHRDIAAASGFRAVAATPLAGYAGRLIGVVSTHYRQPYQPPGLDLQIMGLYADSAGEAIAGHLGVADVDSLADPVGRAVISALLGPPEGSELSVTASLRRGDSRGDHRRRPAHQAVPGDDAMAQFADHVVTQLFSVSLSLEGARSMLGEGPAHDRIAAATDEIDRIIRDVRTTLFSLATDQADAASRLPPQPGGPGPPTRELLDGVVTSVLQAGVLLQAATELPRGTAGLRIADALHRLDDVVRDIRDYTLAGPGQENQPGLAGGSRVASRHLWETADRTARLRERVAQTARALQISAADAITLLEQHAAIARLPGRMNYPAEVKRWRALAEQAGQIAQRWEQRS